VKPCGKCIDSLAHLDCANSMWPLFSSRQSVCLDCSLCMQVCHHSTDRRTSWCEHNSQRFLKGAARRRGASGG
jgi:hypothetical protein